MGISGFELPHQSQGSLNNKQQTLGPKHREPPSESLGFKASGLALSVWSRHRVFVGVGTHPGRSHWCVAVKHPMTTLSVSILGFSSESLVGIPARAQAAPTGGGVVVTGTGHDVMCLEVLALSEAVLPDRHPRPRKNCQWSRCDCFPGYMGLLRTRSWWLCDVVLPDRKIFKATQGRSAG